MGSGDPPGHMRVAVDRAPRVMGGRVAQTLCFGEAMVGCGGGAKGRKRRGLLWVYFALGMSPNVGPGYMLQNEGKGRRLKQHNR